MKVLLCIVVVCIASSSATFGDLFGNLLGGGGGGGSSVQLTNQLQSLKQFSQPPPRPIQKHLVKVIHESSPRVHVVKLVHDDHYHHNGGDGNLYGHHDAIQTVKLVHAVPVEHYPVAVPVQHIHSSGWSYGGGPAWGSQWD